VGAVAAAAAATAGGRSWRRRRCDELCWRETVLLHGEAPSLLEKEETEGKGSAGLFLEEKTGCLSCNGQLGRVWGRRLKGRRNRRKNL